jgi:HD superfamily phosphohydrolase
MTITDRIYGSFEFPQILEPLIHTKELQRLHHVSLSAVPPWLLPSGTFASRFEHSLAVCHLADGATRHQDFADIRTDMMIAALLHDIGTPPFAHVSDPFQYRIMGHTHEEATGPMIRHSDLSAIIRSIGGNPERIIQLISGSLPPYSDMIAGTIDVDNLDNSLRWNLSGGIVSTPEYDPQLIAQCYRIKNEMLTLEHVDRSWMSGWEMDRQTAYGYVYSDVNMAPAAMITRALSIAEKHGILTDDFFGMTDMDAMQYLRKSTIPEVVSLVEEMNTWRMYTLAYKQTIISPSNETSSLLKSHHGTADFSDMLAKEFHLSNEKVSIITGTSKAYKDHTIPITDPSGNSIQLTAIENHGYLYVYVHPSVTIDTGVIQEFFRSLGILTT